MAGRGQRSQLGQGNHSRRRVLERGRMERSNVERKNGAVAVWGGAIRWSLASLLCLLVALPVRK